MTVQRALATRRTVVFRSTARRQARDAPRASSQRRRAPRAPAWRPRGARSTWRAALGRGPGRGVGELVLERRQRGLGRLDLAARAARRSRRCVLRQRGSPALAPAPAPARLRPACARFGRRARPARALLAHAQVLGPAARRRSAACRSSTAIVRVPTASSSARSCETSSSEPWNALQRVLQRLAALEVEVVGGLVEDQHVGAGVDEDRQRQPPALAAGEARPAASRRPRRRTGSGPSSARALPGVSPVARWAASSTRAACRAELLGVLGEEAELDVVAACAACRASSSRRPASVSISVVLPAPLGPTSERARRARATARRRRAAARSPIRERRRPPARSTTRPLRSGGLNAKPSAAAVARVALDALHLVELLGARLRLARAGAGAEARDEALEPLDLRLLALDRAAERELARRLLLAPGVPGPGKKRAAPGLELEHRRCRPPRGTSGRGRRARPRRRASVRCCSSHSSDSMSRWLVGSSSSSRSGSPASARASEARVSSPPENVRERAVEVARRGSRARAASRRSPLAPVVAAGVLEPRLGGRRSASSVASSVRAARPSPARARPARASIASSSLAAGEHVVAQGQLALARRALVVQRDPRALREHELAAVDRGLAGEHPQQRRLARAVAPGQRHPVAALELERDAAQQRLARHVLGEVGCDHDGHGDHGRHSHILARSHAPTPCTRCCSPRASCSRSALAAGTRARRRRGLLRARPTTRSSPTPASS